VSSVLLQFFHENCQPFEKEFKESLFLHHHAVEVLRCLHQQFDNFLHPCVNMAGPFVYFFSPFLRCFLFIKFGRISSFKIKTEDSFDFKLIFLQTLAEGSVILEKEDIIKFKELHNTRSRAQAL